MLESLKTDHWRFERKFFLSDLTNYEIESIIRLHPAMFSEIYHQRYINNIYFDSFAMTNYLDNVLGKDRRLKVRIRWYGNLFGTIKHPLLEVKIKNGLLNSKVSFPLDPILIDNNLSINTLRQTFVKSKIPDIIKLDIKSLDFTITNRYIRKYFQSVDKKFRITLDSNMRFIRLFPFQNSFLNESIDHINNVLELKYEKESDDYADGITKHFPFRITRSSKFVTGIERLYL